MFTRQSIVIHTEGFWSRDISGGREQGGRESGDHGTPYIQAHTVAILYVSTVVDARLVDRGFLGHRLRGAHLGALGVVAVGHLVNG